MKFGKYEIINKIATGGMAEVFWARITGEKGFEKLLVLKKILPHLAAEDKWIMHFFDEAKLAALLQHENIIHIYDFGEIDNSWFLAIIKKFFKLMMIMQRPKKEFRRLFSEILNSQKWSCPDLGMKLRWTTLTADLLLSRRTKSCLN